MKWYYERVGQQNGPVTLEELRAMILSKEVRPTDMVWNSSLKDWQPAQNTPELFEAEATAPTLEISAKDAPTNPYAPPTTVDLAPTAAAQPEASEIDPGSDPINIGACIKHAFQLTKQNFLLLFLAGLIYVVVNVLIGIPMTIVDEINNQNAINAGILNYNPPKNIGHFIEAIIANVASLFLTLGLIRIGLNIVAGEEASVGQIFSQGDKLVRVFFASIVFKIGVFIGLLLFIFPGIYVAMRYGQFINAIVDKNFGIREAFEYSTSLTTNNRVNLFGLAIMGILITLAGALAFLIGLIYALPMVGLTYIIAYRWMQYGERVALRA